MRAAFTLPADDAVWVTADEARSLASVPEGTPFTVPPVLFAKITDEDLASYVAQFGGDPDAAA
jgi:methionyl-tRNA synthetase